MSWWLEGFEPAGEHLVAEHEVGGVEIDALRREFALPEADQCYDSYPLNPDTANRLGLEVPVGIDWDSLSWFLQFRAR